MQLTGDGIKLYLRAVEDAFGWANKKVEYHLYAVALHAMFYNYCRPHQTLTKKKNGMHTTPAMAAGLTDRVSTRARPAGPAGRPVNSETGLLSFSGMALNVLSRYRARTTRGSTASTEDVMSRWFIHLRRALFGTSCAVVFGFGASQALALPVQAASAKQTCAEWELAICQPMCEPIGAETRCTNIDGLHCECVYP